MLDLDPGRRRPSWSAAGWPCCCARCCARDGLEALAEDQRLEGHAAVRPIAPASCGADVARTPRRWPSGWRRRTRDLVVSRMAKNAARPARCSSTGARTTAAKTTVAPYSLRARDERPTVSTPLTWDEVEGVRAAGGPAVRAATTYWPGRGAGRPHRAAAGRRPAPARGRLTDRKEADPMGEPTDVTCASVRHDRAPARRSPGARRSSAAAPATSATGAAGRTSAPWRASSTPSGGERSGHEAGHPPLHLVPHRSTLGARAGRARRSRRATPGGSAGTTAAG